MIQDAVEALWNGDETGLLDVIDRVCDRLGNNNQLRIVEG